MQHGRAVEALTRDDLAARRAADPYTRALLAASRGFRAHADPGTAA